MASNTNTHSIRLGTRSSPLAMKQAEMVSAALKQSHPDMQVEIVPMKSAADWNKQDGEKPLQEQQGGKGQFAKEIEQAILDGKIDCGVHSLKDMPCFLPEGLQIAHVLPRADARDAFVSNEYRSMNDLPQGAKVGTCSPRRQALALAQRADIEIVPFRGNVQTRIDKVAAGQVDATFLAMAGLERLEIKNEMIHPLAVETMLPACGQGIVCIETRVGDKRLHDRLATIHCPETGFCAAAEREILKILDGSCHTPIAAYAVMREGRMSLQALVASLDGQQLFEEVLQQPCASDGDAIEIGRKVGNRLKKVVPAGILA